MKKNNGPKVLLLDIETAPILGYVWGLWDQNVGLNQIKSDWHLLSWSAKWLETPDKKTVYGPHKDIMYMDQRDAADIENDKGLLKGIWKLLDEADIVIGQNSKAFDIKKLNARFIMHGMKPPSSFKQIDTKHLAKRYFGFTSNRLEYLSDKLCTKYKKQKHSKFSGFDLWTQCIAGNLEAWDEMEKYNKYDVLSLEELYQKLSPWDNSINFNLYTSDKANVCPCGNTKFQRNGYAYTASGKYQRLKCSSCGSETRDKTNLLGPKKRKALKLRVVR